MTVVRTDRMSFVDFSHHHSYEHSVGVPHRKNKYRIYLQVLSSGDLLQISVQKALLKLFFSKIDLNCISASILGLFVFNRSSSEVPYLIN